MLNQCDRGSHTVRAGKPRWGEKTPRYVLKRRWDICSWLPKDSRAGEYNRVDAFLSGDGDPCGLAVASLLLSRRNCKAAVCT